MFKNFTLPQSRAPWVFLLIPIASLSMKFVRARTIRRKVVVRRLFVSISSLNQAVPFYIMCIQFYLVYKWIRHCCVWPFSSIWMVNFQHMEIAWKWDKSFQICNLLCLLSNCIITVIFSLINNINIMNFVLI